jgi:hypothetical protein
MGIMLPIIKAMTRYRIQIETKYSIFLRKKEYLTLPQCRKAINMINIEKYGFCVMRIYKFVNEYYEVIDTIVK